MSKDLNKVLIIGRLGKDPEPRYTPQGSAITRFTVASGRRWRTAEGDDREDTEWFNVVAWNKLAETCSQYLQKGSRVYIEGRLQTHSWDDETTGQKRYMTEVIANDMIMLDSRRDSMNGGGGGGMAELDAGFGDQDVDVDQSRSSPPRAQQAARPAGNSGAAPPARQAPAPVPQRSAPASSGSSRRSAAPPPPEDDDLPF